MNLPTEYLSRKQVAFLSLYGLSLVLSPLYGTTEAVLFPMLNDFGNEVFLSRIFNLGGFALAMAVCSFAGERIRAAAFSRPAAIALAAMGMLGMALAALAGSGMVPIVWLWAGALARGLFFGAFTMCWVDVLMRLDDSYIGITVSSSLAVYGLSGLAILGASLLSQAFASAILMLCPALSVLGFAMASSSVKTKLSTAQETSTVPLSTRCLLYLANFAFGVVLGTPLCYFARFSDPTTIVAFAATAIILFALFAFVAENISASMLFRGIMLAYVFVITALLLFGLLEPAAAIVAISALAPVALYAIMIFADTQARVRKPYWKVPGMCQVFAAVGMIMAWVACHSIYPDGKLPSAYLVLCMCMCMIFITSVFAPNNLSRVRPWGFSSLIPAESKEAYTLRRCSELADEYSLTSREHEILQMMATGVSREGIAEAFVISPATVKTHIRNIYSKLGIHSKEELFELIQSA